MKGALASVLRWLVLPWGATTGQRIILDAVNGKIEVYNASNTLVAEINTDGEIIAYATNGNYTKLEAGQLLFEQVAFSDYTRFPRVLHTTTAGTLSTLRLESGQDDSANAADAVMTLQSVATAGTWPAARIFSQVVGDDRADLEVTGVATAGNIAYGSTVITPVASTPTSVSVSGLDLEGSTFYGFATANTSALAVVQEVSATNASATGVTLWIYATSTTNRTINWLVMGV